MEAGFLTIATVGLALPIFAFIFFLVVGMKDKELNIGIFAFGFMVAIEILFFVLLITHPEIGTNFNRP